MIFARKDNNHIQFLQTIPLLAELPKKTLSKISAKLLEASFPQNHTIFRKGEIQDSMYFIQNGSVKVHDGDYVFAVLNRHQFFGEYSLIEPEPRAADVTTISECNLLELTRKDFDEIVATNPELASVFLKEFVLRLRINNLLEEKFTHRTIEVQKEKAELLKQRDELEKERLELMSLNKTKDKFLTIVAHDLKNPFNTILGISELLLTDYDRYDRDQIKSFLEQIHKYSANAYNLLDNLLQWARSQTGRLKLKKALYNIKDIAEETIEILQGSATHKNITIEIDNHSLYMDLDVNIVSTVIRNLVANAIKFTPAGGKIRVAWEDSEFYAKVSIIDNGIGISPEDQAKLFRIDTNPTTVGTSDEKGTGLGLILCKEFVKMHQGEIWVESQMGKGTAFHFTLKKSKN